MDARNARINAGLVMMNKPNIINFMNKVKVATEKGELRFDYEGDLEKDEIIYLTSLGYDMFYNRACMWYEVSF